MRWLKFGDGQARGSAGRESVAGIERDEPVEPRAASRRRRSLEGLVSFAKLSGHFAAGGGCVALDSVTAYFGLTYFIACIRASHGLVNLMAATVVTVMGIAMLWFGLSLAVDAARSKSRI